jgi:hypothetical protein
VNTALAAGDSLYAGDGANFELQTGPRAFVRGGANTQLGLESLESDYMQLKVTGGHAALDLKQLAPGQTLEIDTPTAAFTVDRPGYYRIDVDEKTSAFVARRGGSAVVVPENGETVEIAENQRVVFGSTGSDRATVAAAPDLDPWDRWNDDRTAQFGEAPRSAQYVPREIAGVDDLDRYGDWRDVPEHGHVWVPRDTAADWAPYSTGRWVYDPRYEWTWVDDAPWGWAPYHYGRWVNTGEFWGWTPGPIVVTPVYAPALVAFFGAPGGGVAVGAGLPFVSWCALGFGEPVIPWWGGSRFAGRPYWGGWGGPRYVNDVVVNDMTTIDARNISRFRNMNVRNAMVGIDRGQFGRGRGQHMRPEMQERFQPVRGELGVSPVAASLVPNERRGRRPPQELRMRQVVATRAPENSRGRLRARGLDAGASGAAPPPRIVNARRGAQGRPAVATDDRRPSATAPGASGAATPPVRGEPQQRLGHDGGAGERIPPTPPRHGEPPKLGRSGGAGEHTTFTPPPHGDRPRPGRAPTRPELAAPPFPPNAQQRESRRTHGDTIQRLGPLAQPQEGAHRQHESRPPVAERSERRAPQHEWSVAAPPPPSGRSHVPAERAETRRPEHVQGRRAQPEAVPRPVGGPLAERSSPAVERHEGPSGRERSAPHAQHENERPQGHERTRGEVTP